MTTQTLPAELSRIERMIVAAETPDQVKHVIALADAAIAYANRYYSEQREVIQRARAVRLQAERRLGEILAAMPKATGSAGTGRPTLGGTKSEPPKSDAPTLADLGIDKKLSARAQKLAALPADEFEAVAAGAIPLQQAIGPARSRHRPVPRTHAAAARRDAIEVARVNHISMFATYARQALRELQADREWSNEEIELAEELAHACGRMVRRATAQPA